MSRSSSFRGYLVIIALVVVSYLFISSVVRSLRPAEVEMVLTAEPISVETAAEPAQDEQPEPKPPESPQVWRGAM